jgi:hypothetical protein
MRSTDHAEIHSEVYSTRIEALEALNLVAKGTPGHELRLHKAAEAIRDSADLYGSAPNAALFEGFAQLLEQVALLADWRAAVLSATPDSDRFRKAACARAHTWIEAQKDVVSLSVFQNVAERIKSTKDIGDVAKIAALLAVIPLPVGLFAIPVRSVRRMRDDDHTREKLEQLMVAFIKFTVDGTPLEEIHFLTPGELHDLDIEVRVSRWPQGATGLIIEPVTVEQASTYQMPVFSFPRPSGSGPFQLHEKGRVHLVVPHHMNARPFEFKYVAKFIPLSAEEPVSIVGQRTLLLEGIDLSRNPMTGYPNLDAKIMEVRDRLRRTAGVLQREVLDALTLLAPVANYAGQVVQDNLYDAVASETEFQKRMRLFLRSHPMIGADLEEHPRAGGGITDLSFRGIRLELKSEDDKPLSLDDCKRFVGQTASYAVASGKRIALLCVLDCSKKKRAPFAVEDGIGILTDQQGSSTTFIITVLLQGNLARPSDLSRKAT